MKKLLIALLPAFIATPSLLAQNVGIGTTIPTSLLEVAAVQPDVKIKWSNNAQYGRLLFSQAGVTFGSIQQIGDNYAIESRRNALELLNLTPTGQIALFTDATERMRVNSNGNVGIGIVTPLARLHVADSSVVFTTATILPFPAGPPPISGAGTRMMWYAEKGAFRAGTVKTDEIYGDGSTNWDKDNVGTNSFAAGFNTKAYGAYSTALGYQSQADDGSTALGFVTKASGGWSTAMGYQSQALGTYATAIGWGAYATGGQSATAIGFGGWAAGDASTAMGYKTRAAGAASTAMGDSTNSRAYNSLSIGRYNDTTSSTPNSWVDTEPLLYVGNGNGNATRHNAMVVYKNGNMVLKSKTTVITDPLSYTVPISGVGTRMMWLVGKGAFRAGTVNGNNWDADSIGLQSFATGQNTNARNLNSFAANFFTKAYGVNSAAFNSEGIANGNNSAAFGVQTFAQANGSFALGFFNDTAASVNPILLAPTDPLFTIGNGSNVNTRSNAMVVFRNGNADIGGYTQLGKTSEAAPSIKMKKLTGVSSGSQNTWVNIPHGLTQSKIIAVDIIMTVPGFVNVPPFYTYNVGYEYQYQVAASNIVVINTNGNSANILSKNFTVLITYEE